MDSQLKIIRREQGARSRQFRGVLSRVMYECDAVEILRTEMDAGSAFDSREFGAFSTFHFVIDGTPVFRTSHQSADLMPGDSILFNDDDTYTISNGAPSRAVILSVLWRTSIMEARAEGAL